MRYELYMYGGWQGPEHKWEQGNEQWEDVLLNWSEHENVMFRLKGLDK